MSIYPFSQKCLGTATVAYCSLIKSVLKILEYCSAISARCEISIPPQPDFPLVSIRGVKFFGHQRPLMLLRTIHKRHKRFLTRSPSPGLFNHGCIRRTRSSSPIHPLPIAFMFLKSEGSEQKYPHQAIPSEYRFQGRSISNGLSVFETHLAIAETTPTVLKSNVHRTALPQANRHRSEHRWLVRQF